MEDVDLGALLNAAYPYCPHCDVQLIPAGTTEQPYWYCPTCRAATIATQ